MRVHAGVEVAVGRQSLLQLREPERLDQVVDGAELHGRPDARHVPGGGDDEEVRPIGALEHLAHQVEAVPVR